MRLTKTLDSAQITAAFLADVVTMVHKEWDRLDADEVEVSITIDVEPSEKR